LSFNKSNNATILREQKRQTARTLLKNNIIIKQYIRDNTWISEKDNKIYIKKPKVREAIKEEIILRGGIVQRTTKS